MRRALRGLAPAFALWLGFAILALPAAGQTPAGSPAPALPDPAALDADWWGYFGNAGDSLGERIAAFGARLESIGLALPASGADAERTRRILADVDHLAGRYAEVAAREPPAAPAAPPVRESYTVEAFLELGQSAREAAFESDLEREEVARTAASLAASEARIEDARAAYLALPPAAPERLGRGLDLVRARFLHAINTADLAFRRVRLRHLETVAERLAAAVEGAAERLAADAGDGAAWDEQARTHDAERARLEAEASNLRLRASAFGDDPRERARRRRAEQRLIDLEARIAVAGLEHREARLAADLARSIASPDAVELDTLREHRRELAAVADAARDLRDVWRRATDRERSAAMAQLADAGALDANLAELHRSRIARADEASQTLNRLDRQLDRTRALDAVVGRRIADESGWLAGAGASAAALAGETWIRIRGFGGASLFTINETPVTPAGLVRVAIILLVAWWVSRILRHGIERLMKRRDTMSRASLYTLGRLSHYVILVIAFIVGLSSIGIDFTKFALFVSALGVGLGFGLQAIFSNFVAGLIILFEKSLKVGDFVELESGVHGEVREINIRHTLITTNDNIDILVPNAEFVSGRVTNWTLREANRRMRIPFGVAYGTDKDLVKTAALEAAEEVPFTLTASPSRVPQVWLTEFGDSSLNFELVVWLTQDAVKRPSAVHAAYTWALESALGRHGIEIPFPQRDLNLRGFFGHRDDDGLDAMRGLDGKGPRPR